MDLVDCRGTHGLPCTYILCVLKLAAVSASHCTLVIKAILTNLFTKTLYISNIELYLANF